MRLPSVIAGRDLFYAIIKILTNATCGYPVLYIPWSAHKAPDRRIYLCTYGRAYFYLHSLYIKIPLIIYYAPLMNIILLSRLCKKRLNVMSFYTNPKSVSNEICNLICLRHLFTSTVSSNSFISTRFFSFTTEQSNVSTRSSIGEGREFHKCSLSLIG